MGFLALSTVNAADNITDNVISINDTIDEVNVEQENNFADYEEDYGEDDFDEEDYNEYEGIDVKYEVSVPEIYVLGTQQQLGMKLDDNYVVPLGKILISLDHEKIYDKEVRSSGNYISLNNINLSYGEHNYELFYTGDDVNDCNPIRVTGTFICDYISVDVKEVLSVPDYNDYSGINDVRISLNQEVNGNVEIFFNNKSCYNKTLGSGDQWISINVAKYLVAGNNDYKIIFFNDNVTREWSGQINADYNFDVTYVVDNEIKHETTFYVKLPFLELADGEGAVNLDLGNKHYDINLFKYVREGTDSLWDRGNSIGNITLSNLELLSADSIKFSYNSNEFENSVELPLKIVEINTTQLNISAVPEMFVNVLESVIEGSDLVINVTVPGATGVVIINGNEYNLVNGMISATIFNVSFGDLTVNVTYKGNEKYLSTSCIKNIVVNALTPSSMTINVSNTTISASAVTTVYNGGKYLTATLKDSSGKALSGMELSVVIDGKNFTRTTNDDGQVKVSTNGLASNNYVAKITFDGNTIYANSSTTANVVVKKATPKITAAQKNFEPTVKTKKYSITLKNNQNNAMENINVSIKVNGKTYIAKTNSNGVATFNLKKLTKKGTYKAVITYKGNKNYKKITKTITITVKPTPKITAKAVTFKKSLRTKKYTITLKDNKNKVMKKTKVSLKVNGKTYKVATNAKGKATFKITKLTKKGTYKAVVSFAGNKNFNKATKNVNIKVK